MKKRIILIVLAAVILLGCGIAAWMHFRQPGSQDSNTWVEAKIRNVQIDALSEHGYYYLPFGGKDSIHYLDFASGYSAVLCYKPTCQHDSRDCDAYLRRGSGNSIMFFYQDHLYYTGYNDTMLYRRDATGLSLTEVGIPGKQFIEEQKAVGYSICAPMDGWMYYSAAVTSKDDGSTNLKEMTYIGRLNLTTGKDEVLVQDPESTLNLLAVRSGSVLYARWEIGELDSSAPDYSEQFRNLKVSLERYDTETGSTTVLFQKTRRECHEIHLVYDNKVFYANYPIGEFTNTFVYDMETGEDSLRYENTMLRHLGGGYALYKVGPDGTYKLTNINTGEDLPYYSTGTNPHARTKSDKGVVLWYVNEPQEDGSEVSRFFYVSYEALADGLQETDLIKVNSHENTPAPPNSSTTPTDPSDDEATGLSSLFRPLSFENGEPLADEELNLSIQNLPETVENPQNLPVLKFVCLLPNSSEIWTEDAVHEANQMLANKNIPFRIQFVMITADCYNIEADFFSRSAVQEALKDADLLLAIMTAEHQQEYLMAITDYATGDAQPSLKNAVPHELDWLKTTVAGEVYGITAVPSQASWKAWEVDPTVMEELGLTAEDFQRNYWEMDEIFAKIYDWNGKKPFLLADLNGVNNDFGYTARIRPGLLSNMNKVTGVDYQGIGMYYAIDRSGDSPKVVSILESEVGKKIWEADMRYKKAGYIEYDFTKNWLVNYTASNIGEVFIHPFYETVTIPVGEAVYQYINMDATPTVGVVSGSQNKEAALSLLQLLAEDEAFRDQLCFGKEGRDYELKLFSGEPFSYTIIERDNDAYYAMEFLSPYATYFSEVSKDIFPWIFPSTEGKTRLETCRENLDKVEVIQYPIVFDLAGYEEEMEEIGKILGVFYGIMYNTAEYEVKDITVPAMTPELYDQMLQDIKDAGGDEIQAELQRQLDEWLAANPDWGK